jgi:hypothetical protein
MPIQQSFANPSYLNILNRITTKPQEIKQQTKSLNFGSPVSQA